MPVFAKDGATQIGIFTIQASQQPASGLSANNGPSPRLLVEPPQPKEWTTRGTFWANHQASHRSIASYWGTFWSGAARFQ